MLREAGKLTSDELCPLEIPQSKSRKKITGIFVKWDFSADKRRLPPQSQISH
jgi:hypothetical protein